MSTLRVGLIGVGRMSKPMGARWLNAGYPVAAYDAQPAALEALVAAGATAHASPASVAAASDVVFVLVGFQQHAALGGGRLQSRSVRAGRVVQRR